MQEYPPPYYTTGDPVRLFYREGRRDVRWTAMGLGFLVLMVLALLQYLPQAMVSLLPMMGYDSAGRFSDFGGIEPSLYFLISCGATAVSMILPCFLYMAVFRVPVSRVLPSRRVHPLFFLSLFFIGVALTLAANIPNNWFYQWIESMVPIPSNPSGIPSGGGGGGSSLTTMGLVLYFVRSTVVPMFFEELIFRGVLLGQLRRFGDGFAVFTTALLFGMFHENLPQILFAFLAGLVFGYMVVKTDNIWLAICVHFTNNAIATLPTCLSFFLDSGQVDAVRTGIFFVVFLMAVLGGIYLLVQRTKFFRLRMAVHPLPLRVRMGGFFSSVGILLLLSVNVWRTIWG